MIKETDSKFNRLLSVFLLAVISIVHFQGYSQARFIENKGQWPDQVAYKLRVANADLFFEEDRLTFNFHNPEKLGSHDHGELEEEVHSHDAGHMYHVNFLDADPATKVEAEEPFNDHINYLVGNDPVKWASGVKPYARVNYVGIYSGIDLIYFEKGGHLKYDVVVAPNSDPSQLRMEYSGVDRIELMSGNLIVSNTFNQVEESIPEAYQLIGGVKHIVECEYALNGNVVSFQFPSGYDSNFELVIDPTLVFSSYSGSSSDNFGFSATFDPQGNAYAGGIVFSSGYPTTQGAYETNHSGGRDIGISKFNSMGTDLIYSTYFGGSADEIVSSMVVNANGELVVLGATGSSDLPVSLGCYDPTFDGGIPINYPANGVNFESGSDAFVAVFSASGGAVVGSTFIGGSGNDGLNFNATLNQSYGDQFRGEVIVDSLNNIYVASSTGSFDIPIEGGGIDNSLGGDQDGYVAKLNADVTSLIWSTYFGGSGPDAAYSLRLSSTGDVFVCGGTGSTDMTIPANGLNPAYLGGTADGYVIALSSDGTSQVAGTFLGTSDYDQSFMIDLDSEDDVYVVGQAAGNYPVSASYSNPNSKQFIQKLDSHLATSIYSTVIGNGTEDLSILPSAFMVDHNKRIYLSAWGGAINGIANATTNLPTTWNAIQSSTDGSDFYFMVLEADAAGLLYGSYYGGDGTQEHVDGGTSRFDPTGVMYQAVCAGCGGNSTFPATPGVWSENNGSQNCNLAVLKIDMDLDSVVLGVEPIFETAKIERANVFTPNGDGLNDCFSPTGNFGPKADFSIFDRWGTLLFDSKHAANTCWNGQNVNGKKVAQGTYYYIVNLNGKEHLGYVTLIE